MTNIIMKHSKTKVYIIIMDNWVLPQSKYHKNPKKSMIIIGTVVMINEKNVKQNIGRRIILRDVNYA